MTADVGYCAQQSWEDAKGVVRTSLESRSAELLLVSKKGNFRNLQIERLSKGSSPINLKNIIQTEL